MHKRKYKIISFVLAVTLLLTGIYLDTAAKDAFFLCDPTGETDYINSMQLCGSEMFVECGGNRQQSIELHSFLSLPHLDRVFVLQGKYCSHPELIQTFSQTSDGLVTDYMHQSDGKKRN